jgi:hypothetical protein
MKKETITWIPIKDALPEVESLYLVTRWDGKYRAVIMENWAGVPGCKTIPPQWDGDPPRGDPAEGPVIAWAEMPGGYVEK